METSTQTHEADLLANREEVLLIAVRAGELLLRNGAETYRVEETISRICTAYGYDSEPFALPTGVFASISGDGPPVSLVRRIKNRSIDLGRVARINAFARDVEDAPPEGREAMRRLDAISMAPIYPKHLIFLSYTATAAIFTMLYGGIWQEGLAALLIGTLLAIIRLVFIRRSIFPFFEYFMGGLVAGFSGYLASLAFPGLNAYIVIIGALINLMPGTALVNGIRDMLHGDSVSGISRLGEALLTVSIMAAGAAIGIGAAISLAGRLVLAGWHA